MSRLTLRMSIVKALETRGCWVLVTTGVSLEGCPTLLVCIPGGEFMALEVKTPRARVTTIQEKVMSDIERVDGIVEVVRSVDDALALL